MADGSLQAVESGKLAGKICLVIDLVRQLPTELWFSEESMAHDTSFIANLLATLILDCGFHDFTFCALDRQRMSFDYAP